jgi:hypothetical protein
VKLRVEEPHKRRTRTKVEAFGNLEFFQVQEESAQAQEGAQQPSDRLEKEIWTVGFYVQGAPEQAYRRGRSTAIGSHSEIPSAIGSDRRCTGFNPSHARQKSRQVSGYRRS